MTEAEKRLFTSLLAVERLRDARIKVDHILAIIDRAEGGSEAIAQAGLKLASIFTLDDLHHALSES